MHWTAPPHRQNQVFDDLTIKSFKIIPQEFANRTTFKQNEAWSFVYHTLPQTKMYHTPKPHNVVQDPFPVLNPSHLKLINNFQVLRNRGSVAPETAILSVF